MVSTTGTVDPGFFDRHDPANGLGHYFRMGVVVMKDDKMKDLSHRTFIFMLTMAILLGVW